MAAPTMINLPYSIASPEFMAILSVASLQVTKTECCGPLRPQLSCIQASNPKTH
jgi:hypothetical protein